MIKFRTFYEERGLPVSCQYIKDGVGTHLPVCLSDIHQRQW